MLKLPNIRGSSEECYCKYEVTYGTMLKLSNTV